MYLCNNNQLLIVHFKGGGGGGGGFSPDFCENTILRYELAQILSPKFWAQIFFGGINQKSAMISMYKIHIYIDSESFRQIY